MSEPKWMTIARGELGVREWTAKRPGPNGELSNPRIEWYQKASESRLGDEIAWCSSFLCRVMEEAGLPDTNRAGARSWMRWGQPLRDPRVGCIVVLWREQFQGLFGHVGLFVREDSAGIWILAGNQGDAVTIKPFPRRRLLGFRWPSESMLAAMPAIH